MLTIPGRDAERFCDGVSRRSFLQIGGLALGGLSLPQLLEAESQAADPNRHKAVIMIYLPGGPPHQDMFDLKPEAPEAIRGEFRPIKTKVPGVQICEEFPRLAQTADKLTFIRSLVGSAGRHDAFQCLTGRSKGNQPPGGWPSIGAVMSKLRGPVDPAIPPALGLSPETGHKEWTANGQAGFTGVGNAPFTPQNDQVKRNLSLNDVSLERLGERRSLLRSFDRFRRAVDSSEQVQGMGEFQKRAFGILTSSKLATAMDLSNEPKAVRDRYGHGTESLQKDGAPKILQQFLLARRLVEAGARCVTLGFSRWDWHGNNFDRGRTDFPMLDQGVSALVQDLHERGLDQDVSVVVWGEFGRTPKVNKKGGRDHWPKVAGGLLAGGGMNHGQAIGATDRYAGEAVERPVHFQEVFATLYKSVGIDPQRVRLRDFAGRPHYLVDQKHRPMPELI